MEGNSDKRPIGERETQTKKSLQTDSFSLSLSLSELFLLLSFFELKRERKQEMEAAMGLMRRIPPKHTETALSALLSLMPNHSSDLLSQVDQPLQVSLSLSRFIFVTCIVFQLQKLGLNYYLYFKYGVNYFLRKFDFLFIYWYEIVGDKTGFVRCGLWEGVYIV